MIPAKKLPAETNDQEGIIQEKKGAKQDNRMQNVVKLLIMMLLIYAIIFM